MVIGISGGLVRNAGFVAGLIATSIASAQSSELKLTKSDLTANGAGGASLAGPACQAQCPPDITQNGLVDIDDLVQVIVSWGAVGSPADVNHSGAVDIDDLVAVVTQWGSCPEPSNNSCANPIVLTAGGTAFCTSSATTDGPAEPGCNFCCDDPQVNQDIWYRYTPTFNGAVQFSTCGSADYDTKIAVYSTGAGCTCASGLTLVSCNDDACNSLQSRVQMNVTAGQCYLVRIGGYLGGKGSGTLTTHEFYVQDECFDAYHVNPVAPNTWTGILTWTPGHHAGITIPTSSCGGGNDTIDKWYAFQVPCGGVQTTTITTCGPDTDFDTVLTLYRGDCDNLIEMACNDDSSLPNCQLNGLNRLSHIVVSLQPLTTYYIRVAGYGGSTGTVHIGIFNGCQ